jgi:hypothetical protein
MASPGQISTWSSRRSKTPVTAARAAASLGADAGGAPAGAGDGWLGGAGRRGAVAADKGGVRSAQPTHAKRAMQPKAAMQNKAVRGVARMAIFISNASAAEQANFYRVAARRAPGTLLDSGRSAIPLVAVDLDVWIVRAKHLRIRAACAAPTVLVVPARHRAKAKTDHHTHQEANSHKDPPRCQVANDVSP